MRRLTQEEFISRAQKVWGDKFDLSKENICIEYQGEQHYFPVNIYGGDEGFKERQRNDKIKRDFCDKNNIKLIEIKYTENIEDVLNNCLF